MQPRFTSADQETHDTAARKLAALFVDDNFAAYAEGAPEEGHEAFPCKLTVK